MSRHRFGFVLFAWPVAWILKTQFQYLVSWAGYRKGEKIKLLFLIVNHSENRNGILASNTLTTFRFKKVILLV